jgi:hypothetical protein
MARGPEPFPPRRWRFDGLARPAWWLGGRVRDGHIGKVKRWEVKVRSEE